MKCLKPFLRYMSLIGLMIIVVLTPVSLNAQDIITYPDSLGFKTHLRFKHITQEEGLPSLAVWDSVQDHQGFMWFATSNGLCRYDGYTFKVYHNDPDDPNSINAENILSLYIDSKGVLWVGTWNNGLNVFDRTTERFTRYLHDENDPDSLSNNRVNIIFQDKTGQVWIGTEGGGMDRLDRAKGKFQHYRYNSKDPESLSSDIVKTIIEDHSGQLWIGTLGGGLNRFDPASNKFTRYRHDPKNPNSLAYDNIESIVVDTHGNLWVGTMGGLDYFDPKAGTFTHYSHDTADPANMLNDSIISLYLDESGHLWIGSAGYGLYILDPQTGIFTHFPPTPNEPYSLHGEYLSSIYCDQSGALWISSLSEGVDRLDMTAAGFDTYKNDPLNPGSLSIGAVWTILRDSYGELWIGSGSGGLNKFDPVTGQFKHYLHNPLDPHSIGDDNVFTLIEDSTKALWIGTQRGLNRFDRKTEQFTRYTHDPSNPASLSENWVGGLFVDSKGRLWVGTIGKGLDLFDPVTNGFNHYQHDPANPNSISGNNVVAFAEDHAGSIWIGIVSGGLNKFDPEKGIFTRYTHEPRNVNSLISDDVAQIYIDPTGILWIATSGGLEKYDPLTETFTHYGKKEGLSTKAIFSIVGDAQGKLWVGMQGSGLACFDPVSKTFRNFDWHDGLQSNDFTNRAAYRDHDGKLYFGGADGLNAFYPDQLSVNSYIPPVVITDFRIFNRVMPIGGKDSPLKHAINETDEITLSHRQSVFSFDFAALNYSASTKNQYAYMLEGFDKDWNFVDSSRRFATYTNLKQGTYKFRVKASNNDGMWNETGKSIRIIITPPWWRTWWFYSLITICILGTGFSIYYNKSNQIKKLKSAALALQKSERNYREVFNSTSDALIIHDKTGLVLDVNNLSCAMFGYNRETLIGISIETLSQGTPPYSRLEAEERIRQAMEEGRQVFEWRFKRQDGKLFWAEVALHVGEIAGEERVIASVRDITERKRLEDQLFQAQKMESIGRLAGGVAHDFNNILTAISGNTELALMEPGLNPDVTSFLKIVMKESASAAELTKQLLAFSRKQIIEPKVIDLSAQIESMEKMLGRLIGEDIKLLTKIQAGSHLVKIDQGQMNQIVMNLAVNARDAMPNGGALSFEISSEYLDEDYCRLHSSALPGEYILLSASDTGIGMPEEVKEHLFEPFFTTKALGKGTGLGLATVYGAVKQNNGIIEVYSELGKGSCFKIYFPKASGDEEKVSSMPDNDLPVGGTETILLVEDSADVLNYSRQTLINLGYSILTAVNGEEALKVEEAHTGEIQLLMTDVILPGMNGREIADRLTQKYPNLKVLFCSGYTEDYIVQHGVLDPKLHFIKKPFNKLTLSQKIRSILDNKD